MNRIRYFRMGCVNCNVGYLIEHHCVGIITIIIIIIATIIIIIIIIISISILTMSMLLVKKKSQWHNYMITSTTL